MGVIDLYYRLRKLEKRVDSRGIYSTKETKIGNWIDGKPIYRKVVNIPIPETQGQYNIAHGITNIEKVINCDFKRYSGEKLTINTVAPSGGTVYTQANTTFDGNYSMNFILEATKTTILYGIGSQVLTNTTSIIVVLEYTKTTD